MSPEVADAFRWLYAVAELSYKHHLSIANTHFFYGPGARFGERPHVRVALRAVPQGIANKIKVELT